MSEIWVDESPIELVAGAEPTYTITFTGATTVSATAATHEIYKNGGGSDLSTTLLSGSLSASGNVLTLKKLTNLAGGNTYTNSIKCTVDGVVEVRKFDVVVQKSKDMQ